MAWIESHQELGRHPKTLRAARLLGVSPPTLVGHLQFLWWWALDYADDGNLSDFDAADLAEAAAWTGDAQAWFDALVAVRFLDRTDDGAVHLHDWTDYAGRLVERRQQNAERMRSARAAHKPSTSKKRAQNVQRTCTARAGATVPNRTVPSNSVVSKTLTQPDTPPGGDHGADAPPEPVPLEKKARAEKNLGPLVDAFRALSLPDPTFAGAEARAAVALLRQHPPGDIAACWQDHACGEYGDDFARRDLSFGYLNNRNRVDNWRRWRDQGRQQPTRAAPTGRTGRLTTIGRQGFTAEELRADAKRYHWIQVDDEDGEDADDDVGWLLDSETEPLGRATDATETAV